MPIASESMAGAKCEANANGGPAPRPPARPTCWSRETRWAPPGRRPAPAAPADPGAGPPGTPPPPAGRWGRDPGPRAESCPPGYTLGVSGWRAKQPGSVGTGPLTAGLAPLVG